MESKEYKEGKIDLFVIDKKEDFHKELISLLLDVGFEEDKLDELDSDYGSDEGHYFVFSKGMRVHLFLEDNHSKFVLDTKIPKEELISKIERYFQIF